VRAMTVWFPLLVLLFATADSLATQGGGPPAVGRPSLVAMHSTRQRNGRLADPRSAAATTGSNHERAPLMMASRSSSANGGEVSSGAKQSPAADASKTMGRAMLLLVAFLYGTLNVVLRAVYSTDGPPVASVLSFARQCLSVLVFIPIFVFTPPSTAESDGQVGSERKADVKTPGTRPLWLAALELAVWNVGAQGLINAGVLFTQAARASFLTQTSVVITPLLSALAGEKVNKQVWAGCGLALGGLFLISTSGGGGEVSMGAAADVLRGDTMVLGGALCWSMYIFRTSKIASSYDELKFQFAKNSLMALLYGGWAAWTAVTAISSAAASGVGGWSEALAPLWSGVASPWVWALLAYSAIGPGSVADILQQKGQKETSASESNIILCLESVFTLLCALLFLGEVSSLKEVAGGLLIVAAAALASRE